MEAVTSLSTYNHNTMPTPQILIVGAGPTGLTLAIELARRRVPFRIVDKAGGTTDKSKALVVHARTMEVFARMGVVDEALRRGRRVERARIHAGGRLVLSADMASLRDRTAYPYFLDLNQSDTEDILERRLRKLGHRVEWRTELTDLTQNDDHATAELSADGEAERGEFAYVVGCDGGHSTVRERLGIHRPEGRYPSHFILADVAVRWRNADDAWYAYLTDRGLFFAAPLSEPNRWRLILEEPWDEQAKHDDDYYREHRELGVDELQRLLDEMSPVAAEVSDPEWINHFSIPHGIADRYRRGRCLIAGDAAHVHSPLGGQGMNTGIQDAFNLGWKLAAVVCDGAPASLVDSYERERYPVGEALLSSTDTLFRAILQRDSTVRHLRNGIAHLGDALGIADERMERQMSMLPVGYPDSPLNADLGPHTLRSLLPEGVGQPARPGERAPDGAALRNLRETRLFAELDARRFTVLGFGGSGPGEADGYFDGSGYAELAGALREAEDGLGDLATFLPVTLRRPDSTDPRLEGVLYDVYGELHDRYGVGERPQLVVVRPDGYVGLRAPMERAAEVVDYFLGRYVGSGVALAYDALVTA